MDKLDIKSMTDSEICDNLIEYNLPKFRVSQIIEWARKGVNDFSEMTNLPISLREKLSEKFYLAGVKIRRKLVSEIDGTVKYLFELTDGELIESVFMRYHHGNTVCISTQVGCLMGCKFCASGLNGKSRDLTASEMLSQIEAAARDNGERVSNVVMMGMGEPLDNYDNSIRFLHLVGDERGLGIGMRHISLSTSGVVSGIYKLAEENLAITLSISLHAPTDELRNTIMPINKKWNVDTLISACRDYIKATGRRISFEYAVIDGFNDSPEIATLLAKKLKGMLCHINLIPANPVKENDFKTPNRDKIERFQKKLESLGMTATIRRTLGADINASCGQLRRAENTEKTKGGIANEL